MDQADVENNRRILATYSREKLIQFIYHCGGSVLVGEKPFTELSDEELRILALAITGGS